MLHFLKLHFSWAISPFVCEFFFLHSPLDFFLPKLKCKYSTNLCCPVTLQLPGLEAVFSDWAGVIVTSLDTILIELWIAEAST